MTDAMRLLDTRAEEGWEHELAVSAVFRHVFLGVDAINRVALQTDQAGTDASIFLSSIAIAASGDFMKQASSAERKDLLTSSLKKLRETVRE